MRILRKELILSFDCQDIYVFFLEGGRGVTEQSFLRSMSCQNGNGRWRVGDCIHMDILAFKFQIHIMMITRLKVLKVAV